MTRMAIAVMQPVWDCRWSRPADADQPENQWVCVHDGTRRPIDKAECETCGYWELRPGGVTTAVAAEWIGSPVRVSGRQALDALLRGVLLLVAGLFVAGGFVILTGPLAVPFTIMFWLLAAATAALAIVGRPGEEPPGPTAGATSASAAGGGGA